VVVFSFLAAALACAEAETNAPPTWSLSDVKHAAFTQNWDLLAAKSGIDAATAQLVIAQEFPNPTASLSIARIGTHENATILGNGLWDRSYDSIAAVNQLIEIAGKRHDRQMAGRAGVEGAKARFFDAKRTLDQGVTKAYTGALLAGENARVLRESSDELQQEAKIAQARNQAGDLSDSDRRQIEVNAEQFQLQASAAAAAAVQARIAVEILMSVHEPKGDWRPADSLEGMVADYKPALTETNNGAERPDVRAAEADLRGGDAQLRLQRALRVPDPTVSIGVEHNPPGGGPAVDTFIVGFSFPLPLWNLNGGNIAAARASVDQFEQALGKAKTQARADLANAQVEYDEAHARWLRYRDVTVPKSAQVRESVRFAYERGGATLLDLLNAEQTDNTVRLALALAMSDTANAMADLTAAQNVLPETGLDKTKK
jgi:outer membrane protein, heavy metal efflux system